jgi:hypothetical protein
MLMFRIVVEKTAKKKLAIGAFPRGSTKKHRVERG